MDARHSSTTHLVRLDRGEEVLAELTAYLEAHDIRAGTISGIGALCEVELGAYVLAEGRYEKLWLEGDHELVSFTGTIAMLDGAPFIHPHVVLSDHMGRALGGHLFSATVAVTGEFRILEADIAVSRQTDPKVGLKLWSFDEDE